MPSGNSTPFVDLAAMRQALEDHIRDDDALKDEIRAHMGAVGAMSTKVDTLTKNNEQLMQAVFIGSDGQPSLTTTVSTIKDRVETGTALWRWIVMAALAAVAAGASIYAALHAAPTP